MAVVEPDERWLPPSPHREKVLETIANGRAHLEAQGHGRPPLLLYEDGGSMELPFYRWDGSKAVAAEGFEAAQSTTRFLDVCGSIDELKRIVKQEPERLRSEPEQVSRLVDDALAMIGRMGRRVREYHEFKDRVREQIDRMDLLTGPDSSLAGPDGEALKQMIAAGPERAGHSVEEFFERAEAVRRVAQQLEEALYPLRDCCIEIEALCAGIRGARQWSKKADR